MTSNRNYITGFTDDETVMLDLDNMSFKQVKYLARRTMEFWELGGFLVLRSSVGSYHVVFDRPVSWGENLQVVAWVVLDSGSEDLKRWLVMQCRKGSSTLRVSPKGEKPSPRIVYREGSEAIQIGDFLQFRKMIKKSTLYLNLISSIGLKKAFKVF